MMNGYYKFVLSFIFWIAGYISGWFTHGQYSHPSTNRARRIVTSLIETNVLPLSQTATVLDGSPSFIFYSLPETFCVVGAFKGMPLDGSVWVDPYGTCFYMNGVRQM